MSELVLRYSGPYDLRFGTGFHVWCDDLSSDDVPDGYGSTLEKAHASFMDNLIVGIKQAHLMLQLAESINDSTPLKANTEA
jgi:hypothetical protein